MPSRANERRDLTSLLFYLHRDHTESLHNGLLHPLTRPPLPSPSTSPAPNTSRPEPILTPLHPRSRFTTFPRRSSSRHFPAPTSFFSSYDLSEDILSIADAHKRRLFPHLNEQERELSDERAASLVSLVESRLKKVLNAMRYPKRKKRLYRGKPVVGKWRRRRRRMGWEKGTGWEEVVKALPPLKKGKRGLSEVVLQRTRARIEELFGKPQGKGAVAATKGFAAPKIKAVAALPVKRTYRLKSNPNYPLIPTSPEPPLASLEQTNPSEFEWQTSIYEQNLRDLEPESDDWSDIDPDASSLSEDSEEERERLEEERVQREEAREERKREEEKRNREQYSGLGVRKEMEEKPSWAF